MPDRRGTSWRAPAERSGDGAFERAKRNFRQKLSGRTKAVSCSACHRSPRHAGAVHEDARPARSVLDCASLLALWAAATGISRRSWSIFKNPVASDVSRRKSNRDGIRWRELTFAATGLLKQPWPQADEFRVPGGGGVKQFSFPFSQKIVRRLFRWRGEAETLAPAGRKMIARGNALGLLSNTFQAL